MGRHELSVGFTEQIEGANEFGAGEILCCQSTPVQSPRIGQRAFFRAGEVRCGCFGQLLEVADKIIIATLSVAHGKQPPVQEVARE